MKGNASNVSEVSTDQASVSGSIPRFELRADQPGHIQALTALRKALAPGIGLYQRSEHRRMYKYLGPLIREFELYQDRFAAAARSVTPGCKAV